MLRKAPTFAAVFAPDEPGGLAAAAAAAAGAPAAPGSPAAPAAPGAPAPAAAAPAAPGAPPAAPAASGPYLPDGLTDTFKGASDKETIDKLWKAHQDAPRAPAKADEYKLSVPDAIKPYLDAEKDPMLPVLRKIAHEEGFTQKQYENLVVKMHTELIGSGLMPKPMDLNGEFAALGEGPGDTAAKVQRGAQRVQAIVDRVNGMATRQQISTDTAKELAVMLGDRKSTAAIENIIKLIPAEHGVQGGGQGGVVADINDPTVRARMMYPNSQARKV